MEKYFLVRVKKAFGIYNIGAELPMREKHVKKTFKDNVEVIKELKGDDLGKYKPQVKYRIEKKVKVTKEVEGAENIAPETTENEVAETTENVENEAETSAEGIENEALDNLEDLPTEELLKIANEVYKLNKPSNTGRPRLIEVIKEARAKADIVV